MIDVVDEKWMQPVVWSIVAGVLLVGGAIGLAQAIPLPDRNGDYFSNEAPLKRENPPAKLQAGSLWQVVAPTLNCRAGAGGKQTVVRRYKQATILEAEVGRGGSDEVLVNTTDASGKPWMAVRQAGNQTMCYVRANNRYIRPLTTVK